MQLDLELLSRGSSYWFLCTVHFNPASHLTVISKDFAEKIEAQILQSYPEFILIGQRESYNFPAKKVLVYLRKGERVLALEAVTLPGLPRDILIGSDYYDYFSL